MHPPDESCGWNYLRVRGEYWILGLGRLGYQELPPRARRIREYECAHVGFQGTTSACAENTLVGVWLL